MLRSQGGVGEVEDPYGNLQKGLVKVRPKKDKPLDLALLVKLLEDEIGFAPVTEVTLELRGLLERRDGQLRFTVSGTGETFAVAGIQAEKGAPPANQLLSVVANLEKPDAADRIVVREWKKTDPTQPQP